MVVNGLVDVLKVMARRTRTGLETLARLERRVGARMSVVKAAIPGFCEETNCM